MSPVLLEKDQFVHGIWAESARDLEWQPGRPLNIGWQ